MVGEASSSCSYLMVTAFCHSVRAVLWSTKSRRDGTGVSDRRLSDLYRAALWTVLRSRKYQAGGKSGRQPKGKRYHACCWNFFFKLYRNYRSQYAFCKADYTDELMEKKQASHHGIFHFSCVKYRRMSYTYRRSATAHGIFKRSIVLLEHEAVSGSRIKYDTASYHILSFGQEGLPEGYH